MNIILYSTAAFCIIATLFPLISISRWWIRMFDFPHAQLTFITVLTMIGLIIFLPIDLYNRLVLFALFICFCYQFYIIFPYTPLSPKQVLDAQAVKNSIKILACNVLMHNRNSERCLDLIYKFDPDLVLLVETDKWWFDQIKVIQNRYPYEVTVPLSNTYGMLLFSKFELIDQQIQYLVEKEIPSIHAKIKVHHDLQFKLHCLQSCSTQSHGK